MIDAKYIREHAEEAKRGLAKKGVSSSLVDEFITLDEAWRSLTQETDVIRKEHKEAGTARDMARAKELKLKEKEIGDALRVAEEKREILLHRFPNIPFDDAPEGTSEAQNKVIREVGERTQFSFEPRDYLSLAEAHGLIDTQTAGKVAGSRFGYIKREAALLEFALVQLAMSRLTAKGFVAVVPPVMIRKEVFRGMGRLAHDQEAERYYLEKDDLYLVGSAEHALGPLHMGELLPENELPIRYVGFSTCFRREAGSYGKDTKGILRVHQFDKVEMFSFVLPSESEKEHAFLLSAQENLMHALELPYRVVEVCTGDMGWTDARQFDIEAWIPSEQTYRETHSCSNTTDFQARGMQTKYKSSSGETAFVHMLNATAFAIPRTLIAIIENYQTDDGKIKVPKVLQGYVGKTIIG